jgi:protein-tyrosine phosphatase
VLNLIGSIGRCKISAHQQPQIKMKREINEWFSALNEGQRLLFHCAAGLGRTGTLAARLLIMSGNPPDIAISMVRAVRPGTVESKGSRKFLKKPEVAALEVWLNFS